MPDARPARSKVRSRCNHNGHVPRVSVLLTCFNHAAYLPIALQSALQQTFTDLEIVALDDGSTDGTREALAQIDDIRVRVLLNEANIGTYATINRGIENSTGEFVAILNDDDVWAPDKIDLQVRLMDSDPEIGLVHTGGYFIDGNGNRLVDSAPMGFIFPSLPTGRRLADLIDHNQIITSSVLIRRSVLEEVGKFDPSFYGFGDWQMWLRIARKYKVGFCPSELTLYRIHPGNSANNQARMHEDSRRIREWISTEFTDMGAEVQAHNWACLGTERGWLGEGRGGRAAYAESIKLNPRRLKSYARWLTTFLPTAAFRRLS